MITPSYSLTATERVLPRLALDFTTATLDSRITFTRSGNTATVTNSTGVIVAVNADIPRFDYNPTTLVCNGLLIEEQRTNLLLNSLLNGTNLSTQLVTTTATSTTLSFYGTGQIVLSGTHSATVVGTGAYPTRTTLTFTPTVGVLTLTVTGTVQFAQLEAGPFATSFIPTAASQVTRTADVATMTGANFSGWFNATEGSVVAAFTPQAAISVASTAQLLYEIGNGSSGDRFRAFRNNDDGKMYLSNNAAGSANVSAIGGVVSATGATAKTSAAYKLNNFGIATNGNAAATDTSATVCTADQMRIGRGFNNANYLNGAMAKLFYYPQRLTNAELQAFSK